MKVNHIGYLVKNLNKAKTEFEKLGYMSVTGTTHDTIRMADICFMQMDSYIIELISPYDEKSVVAGMVKKYRNMPYHICYETQDFEMELNYLLENGYVQMGSPQIAPALDNRRVVFLLNAKLGMVELLETVNCKTISTC